MPLTVMCPNPSCGQLCGVNEEHAGKDMACPFCQKTFRAPAFHRPPSEAVSTLPASIEPPVPEKKQGPTDRKNADPNWGKFGGLIAFCVFFALARGGCFSGKKAEPEQKRTFGTTHPSSVAASSGQQASLNVSGRDATLELQQLVDQLTDAEALALGVGVILTGTDTYAARIRIANTGTVPVRVFPENLIVRLGNKAASVFTIGHAQFLQQCILQPGHVVEGLVMYRARIDVGAAIRLGAGTLSYDDPTIEVRYSPW